MRVTKFLVAADIALVVLMYERNDNKKVSWDTIRPVADQFSEATTN